MDRSDPVALLIYGRGVHRLARIFGADVQPVGLGGPETHQLPPMEDGRDHVDIVEVAPHEIAVVDRVHIARPVDVLASEVLGGGGDGRLQAAQEDRQAGCLPQQIAVGPEQTH